MAKKTPPKNPRHTAIVLEESDGSDEIPLAGRLQPRNQPPPASEAAVQVGPSAIDHGKRPVVEPEENDGSNEIPLAGRPQPCSQPPPTSEAAVQIGPSAADRGKRPGVEPEATTETLVHPQDQDFTIPPQ
ncbi:hypothetical protein COP2_004357 [Malus domestica]